MELPRKTWWTGVKLMKVCPKEMRRCTQLEQIEKERQPANSGPGGKWPKIL